VLEHLGGDDPVERLVGERQRQRVTVDHPAGRAVRQLARGDHPATHCSRVLELGGVGVKGDDHGATSHRLERVTSAATTEVEQRLAVAQIESFEVDGQHQRAGAPLCSSRSAR
jgi:hypothetical protein